MATKLPQAFFNPISVILYSKNILALWNIFFGIMEIFEATTIESRATISGLIPVIVQKFLKKTLECPEV